MRSWSWIIPRAEELWSRSTESTAGSGSPQSIHFQTNTTASVQNAGQFAIEKPIRTTIIILACINVVAALTTVAYILWQSHKSGRRSGPRKHSFHSLLNNDASFFLFSLSCGVVVQGIIFAIAQSKGLESLTAANCSSISQTMLPALFIPSYIQLTFALCTTTHALQIRPFSSKRKWRNVIRLVVAGILLLGTLAISLLVRPPDSCFASLLWLLQPYSLGCGTLLAIITAILLISGLIIGLRLRTTPSIDITELVSASHIVYYLAVGALLNCFVIPFFVDLSIQEPGTTAPQSVVLSTMASIVLNMSGVANGGLYLLLRSNKLPIIGSGVINKTTTKDKKKMIRAMTPSDCDFGFQITRPLSPPQSLRRSDSVGSLIGNIKDEEAMLGSLNGVSRQYSNRKVRFNMEVSEEQMPKFPDLVRLSTQLRPKSLVRTDADQDVPAQGQQLVTQQNLAILSNSPAASSPSIYGSEVNSSVADLLAPPSIPGIHHKRDSSIGSSATVQIGLRLSNVDDLPLHDSAYFRDSTQSHDLGCPDQTGTIHPRKPSPLTASTTSPASVVPETSKGGGLTLSPDVYIPRQKSYAGDLTPERNGFNMTTSKLDSPRSQVSPGLPQDGPEVKHQDWI